MALLGLGISGLIVYFFPRFFSKENLDTQLFASAFLFSITTLIAIVVFANLKLGLSFNLSTLIGFIELMLFSFLPFFFGGLIITLLFTHASSRVSKIYFFDLIGAGLGCLSLILLLEIIGGINVILFAGFLGMIAAVFFSLGQKKNKWSIVSIALAIVFLGIIAINANSDFLRISYAKGIGEKQVFFEKWNSFSRITVTPIKTTYTWALSDRYNEGLLEGVEIKIDSDAATPITKFDGNLESVDYLRYNLTNMAYYANSSPEKVLIIGSGGGLDILSALLFSAKTVYAVEINPIIVNDIMKQKYLDYSGEIYSHPRVKAIVSDGRAFVRNSKEKFSIIQATLVDTFATSSSGALSLTENTLYTKEAFVDYLNHLEENGIVSITRWNSNPPKESLRLVSLGLEAMRELGIKEPEKHLIIIGKNNVIVNFLLKKTVFAQAEIDSLREKASEFGFDVLFAPDKKQENEFNALVYAENKQAFFNSYPREISPTTDDKPFFFYTLKAKDTLKPIFSKTDKKQDFGTVSLVISSVILTAMVLAFLLLPLFLAKKHFKTKKTNKSLIILFFAFIGIGFIAIEISLFQKFALFFGNPTYSLSIVLFSLLVSSGIGSLLTNSIKKPEKIIVLSLALLIMISLAYNAFLLPITTSLLGNPIAIKAIISIMLIFPLGLLMGMNTPLWIKIIEPISKETIPWGWAINGATSVFGSIIGMIIAINYGFSYNMLFGAIGYILALLIAVIAIKKFD